LLVSAPVDCVPDVGLVPDHAPLATHEVAFELDHVSVDDPPDATLVGDALSETVGAGATATVALWLAEPPVPVHVSVYVPLPVSAPVDCVPDVALVPDHAPLAVHEVALVLDHVSVEDPPEATVAGDAASVTVGAPAIDIVVVCSVLPPVPVQVSVYVAFAASAPVDCVPDVPFVPDHAPLAVQDVAFVLDQVSVDDPPDATLDGDPLSETVGAGAIVTVASLLAEPPVPVHVSVNVPSVVRVPVDCVPEVALLPDQAPDAEHALAFVLDHVSVADPPDAMLDGATLSETVGADATVTVALFVTVPPSPVHASV
jgi:hypothetical protein